MKEFIESGILGLDAILGGDNSHAVGRIKGERILITGPPGSGKTLLALSLLYKALVKPDASGEAGLFLTTDEQAYYLINSASGLFMDELPQLEGSRIFINDFPPYPIMESPSTLSSRELVDEIANNLKTCIKKHTPHPRHVIIDSLSAMQSVLNDPSEARRLTYLIKAYISTPQDSFDLIVATSEGSCGTGNSHSSEQLPVALEAYLFDTIIYLDIALTPADRRLRTIEIVKSRGRHSRSGRHTFSILNKNSLNTVIHSKNAQAEIIKNDVPIVVYPREPRTERAQDLNSINTTNEYVPTGVEGLDQLFDRDHGRGLLKFTTTVVIGGPAAGSSVLCLRYLTRGLELGEPVLLIGFGRDFKTLFRLGNKHPWIKAIKTRYVENFHFLHYRPINLDQNRMFYEIRKEIQANNANRVVIDSISSLPLLYLDTHYSNDFLVTFIGLLKELNCTAMFSYVSDKPPEHMSTPVRSFPSLAADNIIVLRNEYGSNSSMKRKIFILKGRGTNAIHEERELYIGEDLVVRSTESD